MNTKTGIWKALEIFDGSPTKLAEALLGSVLRQHVEHWLKTGRVPAERCPAIEAATGGLVRCEDLRPDVAWHVLRQKPDLASTDRSSDAIEAVAQEVAHG